MRPVDQPDPPPGERTTIAARVADLMAPPLILLMPFVGFLRHHNYEFWRPESLLSALLLIGLGLLISGLIRLW